MSLGVIAEPEHLTKDRLKQELERFDIAYEPNENKSYYVNLYKKKLLSKKPVRRVRSEFSSDEDIRFKKPSAPVGKKVYKKVSQDTYLDQVKKFSDAELATELKKYDSRIGPIVESTRAVYQRKLASLMSERLRKAAIDHRGEDQADHESYSESENQSSEEEEEESIENEPTKPATTPKASSYSHLVAPASFSALKRFQERNRDYDEFAESKDSLRYAELPSKIPQVESKKFQKIDEGKQRQEFKFRKELNIPKYSSSTSVTSKPQSANSSQRQSMCGKIVLLQFLIAFIVAFFAYILYTAPENITQLLDQIRNGLK